MLLFPFFTPFPVKRKGGLSWFPGVKVMQVEALLGVLGVVAEMLISDADGILTPLPALPRDLPSGTCRGLCVRHGIRVDLSWQDGRLIELTLHATQDARCRIDLSHAVHRDGCQESAPLPAVSEGVYTENDLLCLTLKKGDTRTLCFDPSARRGA